MEILVIGDVMVDHYIFGKCERISPEAPVPVVALQEEKYLLGGAGNVVENLHALGCKTGILSIGGDDDLYFFITQRLMELSCDASGFEKLNDRPTTIKTRVLAGSHQLIRIDKEKNTAISSVTEEKLAAWLKKNITKYKVVLISDYNKGLLTENFLQQVFAICNSHNIITILDTKVKNFDRYKGATYIKPNRREAEDATGIKINSRETILEACQRISAITACEGVILTLSEDGIATYTNETLMISSTKALKVVDVTGAGDTVLASLGYYMAKDKTLDEACEFANKAAAIVVSKVGCATVSEEEVMQYGPTK